MAQNIFLKCSDYPYSTQPTSGATEWHRLSVLVSISFGLG